MINIDRFRAMSSYGKKPITEKSILIQEAIREFDDYAATAPNGFTMYINNGKQKVYGVMQDITDLEMRTDTKYFLTSLENKIYAGDVMLCEKSNLYYLCIYEKVKTTQNCYKYKIQPCNAMLNFIDKNTGIIRKEPIITNVYFTDIRNENIPIPWNSDLYGISIQKNDFTDNLKKQDRIFLYESAWEICGIDYTNINYQTDKGFYRFMIKPTDICELDNVEKKICDYYKYYKKPNVESIDETLNMYTSRPYVNMYSTIHVNTSSDARNYNFIFKLNDLNCRIINKSETGFDVITNNQLGNICISALDNTTHKECGHIIIQIK